MTASTFTFNFMRFRKLAMGMSIALIVISIGAFFTKQLNLGLDFTGGTLIEVKYPDAVDLESVRAQLVSAGISSAVVQHFGTASDVLIRVPPQDDAEEGVDAAKKRSEEGDRVFEVLEENAPDVIKRRIEFVGPQVGDELRDKSGIAMLMALGMMLIYVGFRFTHKFAIGAVVALFHDVVIVLGAFSLFQWQFDLTVLAAVLAVIGYSLNDTIVVADRIRENFRKTRKDNAEVIINDSIVQTWSRTIRTSLTTLLVLLALFFLGGELIHGFAIALLVGVGIGTYSSIYVASNVLLVMDINKEDFIVPEKEEVDDMP